MNCLSWICRAGEPWSFGTPPRMLLRRPRHQASDGGLHPTDARQLLVLEDERRRRDVAAQGLRVRPNAKWRLRAFTF